MNYKYIYRNKKTNQVIHVTTPISGGNWVEYTVPEKQTRGDAEEAKPKRVPKNKKKEG